jgi:hypothetical protein
MFIQQARRKQLEIKNKFNDRKMDDYNKSVVDSYLYRRDNQKVTIDNGTFLGEERSIVPPSKFITEENALKANPFLNKFEQQNTFESLILNSILEEKNKIINKNK